MVQQAPRYDGRLLDVLRQLDDRSVPMAETCRRLGEVAESLGLMRPSYVHLRRIIQAHRDEQDAVRAIVEDVVGRLLVGRYVDGYDALERLREAQLPRRLS